MKCTVQSVLLAAVLTLGGGALARASPPAGSAAVETRASTGFWVPAQPKALLERLHFVHEQQVQLGQLALRNSQDPGVQAYAQRMVQVHQEADSRLLTLAQEMGLTLLDTPRAMNDLERALLADQKAEAKALKDLQGWAFDSRYLASQVAALDLALGKVLAARPQQQGAPEGLRQLLDVLAQALPHQRAQAYAALGKVGPQSLATGGSGREAP